MCSSVFFTADTHFNHRNILLFRKQFYSINEMNDMIIGRWNQRVKKGDRVYHLGDVALGQPEATAELLSRLNGQIFLVRGNHESVAEHKLCRDRFVWVKDYFGLKVGKQKIYLCHYAFRTWNQMHCGSWHLYGHSHGTLPELDTSCSFDVGMDSWNFAPVSFQEIEAKMATKKFKPIDCPLLDAIAE
jgi:calcineurin-like phosphoesterase family protein